MSSRPIIDKELPKIFTSKTTQDSEEAALWEIKKKTVEI